MGFLKRISYFVLSFLLVVESQGFAFYLVSPALADEFDKQRESCKAKSSMSWDPSLNRCITKKDAYDDRQSFRECEKITDYAEQRECFDKNAADMIGNLEPKKAGLKEMQKTAEALGYIQMLLEMIAKDGANAKCMSSKVMAAAGIVGMGVDIYLSFFVEDELNELQDKYAKNTTKEKQTGKGTYEAQIEAFNYLQKEQETLISIDEKKIIAYGLMTGLNGVAMLLAIYEMTPFGAAGACTAEAPPGEGVDIPDAKVADVDGGKKGAPDVEAPEPSDLGGGDPKKSDRFKKAAEDVKAKQKVIDAFPEKAPDVDVDAGKKKPSFADVAGDVKTKKKVVDAFPEKAPDVDTGAGKKKPSFADIAGDVKTKKSGIDAFPEGGPPKKTVADLESPKMTKKDPGPAPQPPKRPDILNDPPGDIPPPPKKPKDPGYLGMEYTDPPEVPPRTLNELNQYGDFPRGGKAPELPPEPPRPPRGVADPGPPPTKYAKGDIPGVGMEPPVPPKKPESPAGVDIDRDGNWVQANKQSVGTSKKDVSKMTDADIDSLDINARDKQKMKDLRAKKQNELNNIQTQEKKYGKDFAGRDKLEKDIAGYDKQSFAVQDSSQRNAVGRTQKQINDYKAEVGKYDIEMESYNKKKADFDNAQKGAPKSEVTAEYQAWEQQKQNFDQKKQDIKKFNEDYKKWEGDVENYQADAKKYRQEVEDFKQNVPPGKKRLVDDYAADLDNHNSGMNKTKQDIQEFDTKWVEYENQMDKYKTDKAAWKKEYGGKVEGTAAKKTEFEMAQKKYDQDSAKYDADMDSWSKNKKDYEVDKTNFNKKQREYDAEVAKIEAEAAPKKVGETAKAEVGPAPEAPTRPNILDNPPGDVPPPPKKPVDPGYMEMAYTDPPEVPPRTLKELNQYGEFPRGGKAPELPSEPPRPPRGAADPGSPPAKTRKNAAGEVEVNPEYQKWEVKKQKFEDRKVAVKKFNEDYPKWEGDVENYQADAKKYRQEVEDFKKNVPPGKKRLVDDYAADLDNHNSGMNKTKQDIKEFDNKWIDYENQMDKYKTDKAEWKKQYGDNVGGGDPVKKAEFEKAQKQYDQSTAKYDADMDSYRSKKQAELDRVNKKFGGEEPSGISDADKKSFYDWATPKVEPEGAPKKSFKDVAGEAKDKKKVLDAFEPGAEATPSPEVPKVDAEKTPKKSFKDVAEEVKTEKKVIDAFEKPPEKPVTPEPPKSAWDKFKDGASKFFDWFKQSPIKKGAQVGTKAVHIKTQFYKGGKEVEYCDSDLEEDCEEKKTEVPVEKSPGEKEREKSKAIENPNESSNRLKKINFDDPNEVLSSFLNHKFEDKGLENIEDALMLEEEWKNQVSGQVKSPSVEKYRKMQGTGLFGKNPFMANVLHNVLVSFRKTNLSNALFADAIAQDSTSDGSSTTSTPSTSGAVSGPKNTFEEETDDEEDKANKKARQEQKGKDAGVMVGSAAGGMIGGALLSAGLDKLTTFKGALGKLGKVVDKVRVFFGTSPGIAVLSGISSLINGLTLGFVVEEKKAFEENVKKIKDIKAKFEEDMASFCPNKKDRETQSKPQCYCYETGGKRNPLRRNSDICKSYYARFDGSFFAGAGSYEFKGEKAIKGCVGLKGNYDFDCSCRKYKDRASGQNACMKVNNSFDGLGNLGSSNSVGVLTSYANDIAEDPATIHRLDGDAVGRNAVKMKKASDQALMAFNKQRVSQGQAPFTVGPKELENFTNKVMGLPESRGAMQALQEAKAAPARPPMALPKDLKLAEEKKVDLSKLTYESTKKKTEEKKEDAKAKAPDWDFLAEEKKEKEDLSFMDKSFDYSKGAKKNEIVEKSDVSIFQVISNRYINTGLKLLFEEEKK